jgi:hypothetical protein
MRQAVTLLMVLAISIFGSAVLFAQCPHSVPVVSMADPRANAVFYLNLSAHSAMPAEFCPWGGGNPANAPALRTWQLRNAAEVNSWNPDSGGGPPYRNLWAGSWLCNGQTLYGGNEASRFYLSANANWIIINAALKGCPNENEIVFDVGWSEENGTANHTGYYAAWTIPWEDCVSAYTLDIPPEDEPPCDRRFYGPVVAVPIPVPAVGDVQPLGGASGYFAVSLTIKNPDWYTELGLNEPINNEKVILGCRFLFGQAPDPGPTSSDPEDYDPVRDPASPEAELGIVPLDPSGTTVVVAAIPESGSTDPYRVVVVPVYETDDGTGKLLTSPFVSANSEPFNAPSGAAGFLLREYLTAPLDELSPLIGPLLCDGIGQYESIPGSLPFEDPEQVLDPADPKTIIFYGANAAAASRIAVVKDISARTARVIGR